MNDLLLLNGKIMPLSEGQISVEDRGFQFADGIYETLRCYNQKPFHLDLHLERLQRSAEALNLQMPCYMKAF